MEIALPQHIAAQFASCKKALSARMRTAETRQAAMAGGALAAAAAGLALGDWAPLILFLVALGLFLARRPGAVPAFWLAYGAEVLVFLKPGGPAHDIALSEAGRLASVLMFMLLALAGFTLGKVTRADGSVKPVYRLARCLE